MPIGWRVATRPLSALPTPRGGVRAGHKANLLIIIQLQFGRARTPILFREGKCAMFYK